MPISEGYIGSDKTCTMRIKEDGVLPKHAKIVAISPQSIFNSL